MFKKDAATIARSLASKKVSPKGPSSGMRMLTFYVNRAGKNLPQSRLKVLDRAKELLHERIEKSKDGNAAVGKARDDFALLRLSQDSAAMVLLAANGERVSLIPLGISLVIPATGLRP